MGNNVSYEMEDGDDIIDDDSDELILELDSSNYSEQISSVLGRMVSNIIEAFPQPRTDMPVIRKKPEVQRLRESMLYKEIKALCGWPANGRRPSDQWSLQRGLNKRECGMVGYPPGSFTANQQRRIANLFVPNKKEERLMSLESKVFISKFNKDGSKLITACQDAIVRIFDSSKGTYHRINRIKATDVHWGIMDIDFSPCGRYFVYSTWSDYLFVLPVESGSEEFQWINLNPIQSRSGFFSVRFSPDSRMLIGGCNDSCIYMYERETLTTSKIRTQSYTVDINAVSYVCDHNSDVFVSGCNNGVIKLWDRRCLGSNKNSPVGVLVGHLDSITYIDPRNDGYYILSNSKDQSIKIWDLRKTTRSDFITKNPAPFLKWDYRWDMVPREYYNPTTTLEGDVSIMTYRGHRVTKSLLRAKFSPAEQTGQRYIYTGCGTGRIIIYDVLTGLIKEAIESHKDIVRDLDWHPRRAEIVSSSWDTHVNLNVFKRDPLLKRPSNERRLGPVRRSRRIANQNGGIYDRDELDERNQW